MQVKLHARFSEHKPAREAADLLESCVHCGFCNATCPTYQDLFDERDGPRGRIYLIKHMLESGEAGDATRTHLDRCLTCRACETTCPSGVQYGRVADAGRELVEQVSGRPGGQKLLRRMIRWIFPYPQRINVLLGLGRIVGPVLPRSLRRQIPAKQITSNGSGSSQEATRKMIVLGGCVQAAATPRTNDAARRVLGRFDIDLQESRSAVCCGAVDYHLGAQKEGLEFVRRNIDAWWPQVEAGAEAIVTTASGCGVMVKDYGELLKDDEPYAAKAKRISELAKDLCEVLEAEDLSVFQDSTVRRRTAVHCPCTLVHGQNLGTSLERILERAGVPLADTTENHLCCGSAGTYSLLQADISQRLLKRKLAALSINKPEQIVTANIGCQLHLGAQSDVPVLHWIELLDDE
ncbi:MAG: glycolate oxidase subunit GlcF [Gammaproteobacteria bacterium]|nr:glycolate oxidase subunit GlcF [Gammaproteobacteria bacterium]